MSSEQKCDTCQHAAPSPAKGLGCPWSIRYEPVPGWDATPTRIANQRGSARFSQDGYMDSYAIRDCPLYKAERPREQEHGKTRTLTYQGKTQTLRQWAEEIGLPVHVVIYRYESNWPVEKILDATPRKKKKSRPVKPILGMATPSKPIEGTCLETGERRTWASMRQARNECGFQAKCIRDCCNGEQESHKGWKFSWVVKK